MSRDVRSLLQTDKTNFRVAQVLKIKYLGIDIIQGLPLSFEEGKIRGLKDFRW